MAAESILTLNPINSLAAIPYLIEDVAHGSLEYYGIFYDGDAILEAGRVRVAAVKLVVILKESHSLQSTRTTGRRHAG